MKLEGSVDIEGYVVLAKAGHFGCNVRNDKGAILGRDLDDSINLKKEVYLIRPDINGMKYRVQSAEFPWILVQSNRDSALFFSEKDAEEAFDSYLEGCNHMVDQCQKFTSRPHYKREDLLIKIMKIRYVCGMEVLN